MGAGQWKDGEMSGQGKMSWPSGAVYEGGYREGQKCGEGILTWPDGRIYKGQWENNEQHGRGMEVDVHGRITRGCWSMGKLLEPGQDAASARRASTGDCHTASSDLDDSSSTATLSARGPVCFDLGGSNSRNGKR